MADSFFTELKRRNVFKVGVAYLVLTWVVIHVTSEDSITSHTGRKLDFIIIGLLVIVAGYFIYESRFESQYTKVVVTENIATEKELEKKIVQELEDKSIAVLPFVNMSSDEDQEYFADEGVQLHGGAGFMDEYPISQVYADARITRIFAGTSEIMKLIIARSIFNA